MIRALSKLFYIIPLAGRIEKDVFTESTGIHRNSAVIFFLLITLMHFLSPGISRAA